VCIILSFRPATADDYEYLYRLNEATMREYAEQTYGPWDESVARRIFAERFRPVSTRIVVIDGRDVGMLEVLPTETGLQLANIRIAPEHQGRGIGTRLITGVLRDAHARGLSVTLRVLKVNPARRLYERLGFVVIGETATYHLMQARPESRHRAVETDETSLPPSRVHHRARDRDRASGSARVDGSSSETE
jgi:ribosomal protein S18 acetylase RimI-like enzyme